MKYTTTIGGVDKFPWKLTVNGIVREFADLLSAEEEGLRSDTDGKGFHIQYVPITRVYCPKER